MKIRRYTAKDMRQALRQVRDHQGPDAVILSSRRVGDSVEVVAAIDFEADAVADSSYEPAVDVPDAGRGEREGSYDFAAVLEKAARADAAEADSGVGSELKTLRRMLETQLATLAWNDLSRRAPVQTELLKELTQLGLSQDLAAELAAQLPPRLELAEAQRTALALIARRIPVTAERWLEQGGMVALVGPTGVGKTTVIAKLAARWVLRHGPRDIALISADSVRIGAQDQIHTLGRLLGIPAYTVESAADLEMLLPRLANRRFVLIDTAGFSQRDARLATELAMLAAASPKLETALVFSASAQAGSIEETFTRFAPARPACAVLTKLDEAVSLGGSISALLHHSLPLMYVSEGQRVPEDLNPARAHQLLARAVELSRRAGANADEDLLRRRFGGVAHALA